jgi:RNA exonuclease 4
MANTFFSKKQKAEWRERQKKKKLNQNKENDAAPSIDSKRPLDEEVSERIDSNRPLDEEVSESANSPISKKRPREEEAPEEPSNKKPSFELTTKVVQGKIHVLVPSNLSTQDAKKFRKDARRKLRTQGKDDSNIEYVTTDEMPKTKKKKKKVFPSIKELLQQKQQLDQTQKEEDKLQKKIQQIPDELKVQYVACDCEMVGIGTDGKKSALARVSIVDWDLNVLLDTFVQVPIRVTDFRTHVSGVEPKHIKNSTAMDVTKCRSLVASLLKDKILVGHALTNDLKALLLTHPKHKIRDTAKYRPFQRCGNGKWRPRKLRDLVKENLKGKESFQEGEHDSVQDSKANMELFQLVQAAWEKEIASKTK